MKDKRDDAIPFRLRVGVTGHRVMPDDEALVARVDAALERARGLAPLAGVTPILLTVVSSLAEGADRLVAYAALRDPDNLLEVILPLPGDDYSTDFATAESRREFADLLGRADSVSLVGPAATREEAYLRAGQDMAERSDILIALWDGQPARGTGGTGEIVAFARDRHLPLIWVETAPPFHVHEELNGVRLASEYRELDAYNRAAVDEAEVARAVERQSAALAAIAEEVGFPAEALRPVRDWIAPLYARADARARAHQRRFLTFGAAIFLLGAAATVTVSFQRQFFPRHPLIALAEALFIAANWAIVYAGRDKGRLQRRWIAYRALAERLRSRLFLALLDDAEADASLRPLAPAYQPPEDWVGRAFEEAWRRRPISGGAPVAVDVMRRFLVRAWLQDQITFYRSGIRKQLWRDRQLDRLVNIGWALTVLVVLLHAFDVVDPAGVNSLLIILAVALPAFAGAARAIGDQRDYARNAARYSQIAAVLAAAGRRMEVAATPSDLRAVALEAEAVLLEENRDWVFSARFNDLLINKS